MRPTVLTVATIAGASTLAGCEPLARDFGRGLGAALGAAVLFLLIAMSVGLVIELVGFALVIRGTARKRPALVAVGLAVGACTLVLHLMFAVAAGLPLSKDTSAFLYPCLPSFATVVSGIASLVGLGARSPVRKAFAVAVGSALVGAGGILLLERHLQSPIPLLSGDVRALAIGRGHACILAEDSTVSCGGDDSHGKLGTERRPFDPSRLGPVPGIRGARAIATGDDFSCALVDEGLTCWGRVGWLRDVSETAGAKQRNEELPPTIIAKTPGLREVYASAETVAWRTPEGRVVIHEGVFFTSGEVPVPSDTTQFVVGGSDYCFRTSAGRVGCRSTSRETKTNGIVVGAREIAFPIEDARKIAIVRTGVCVERIESIECYRLGGLKPSRSDANAEEVGPPVVTLDARHMAATDTAVCGGRGTKIVCASLSEYEPGRQELDVGASVDDLTSGVGGYCARLANGAFACFDAFSCFDAWLRRGDCTPRVRPSPVRTPNASAE